MATSFSTPLLAAAKKSNTPESCATQHLVKVFSEPVNDAQVVFRQVLKAMSEPGTIVKLPTTIALPPLYGSTFAICQTLLDQQTNLWLAPLFRTDSIKRNLHFHTGIRLEENKQKALFAITTPAEVNSYSDFLQGNHEYPEHSCTVLMQVDHIATGVNMENNIKANNTTQLQLTGPGIKTARHIVITNLTDDFLAYRSDLAAFPLGIDVIFVAPEQIVCLPRTTKVEVVSCMSQ